MILAVALGGCAAGATDGNEIDSYIRSLGILPAEDPQIVEGQKSAPAREGDYSCTIQDYSEVRRYDEIVAYSANSEAMWPGAILRGDSVYSGLFTQAVFDRKPLAISVSLENLAGVRSQVIESPTLSSSREAVANIVSSEITGDTPANIYAEIEEVHSEEQLALAMGTDISVTGAPFSISASFNFNDETVRSRYLVKYVQAYYTVDVDQPGRPSDFLADSVTLEEISEKFGPDNPPVYVSSVTYGRTVLFTFESEYSATELGSALDFTYSGGVDVSGRTSVTYKEMISNSKITAYILGGSGGDAAQTIDGYEALKEFIRSGGNYSRESPGAPIAYKLAYLADNAPARLSFSEDYQVKNCVRVSQKVLVTLDSLTVEDSSDEVGGGDALEVYGTVTAAADNGVTMWERGSSQYISIKQNETYPATDTTPLGEAILQVTPEEGSVISLSVDLFDADDLSGDDDFEVVVYDRAFEAGWRDTIEIVTSSGDARIRANVSMQPI